MDALMRFLNKTYILDIERKIQSKIMHILDSSVLYDRVEKTVVKAAEQVAAPPPPTPPERPKTVPRPVDVNGFYMVTGDTEATFYATISYPDEQIETGWGVIGLIGLIGNARVNSISKIGGEAKVTSRTTQPYLWSFTFSSDTEQVIDGVQYATGAFLYPPNVEKTPSQQRKGEIYGEYFVRSHTPYFYFSAPPPEGFRKGWYIVGLPTLPPCEVIAFEENISTGTGIQSIETGGRRTVTQAVLRPADDSVPPNTETSVKVQGEPTMAIEPKFTMEFRVARLRSQDLSKLPPIVINYNVVGRTTVFQRDLNEDIREPNIHEEKYIEVKNRGFSLGSIASLHAIGPQDAFLASDDMTKSAWNPEYKQHTNFVMYQRTIPIAPQKPGYAGQTTLVELKPTELGHLLSNMYFTCKIPVGGTGYKLNENIGRALIKQVDLMINETVIETLYDDWYIIRDQIFLDADEQAGMYSLVGGLNSNVQTTQDLDVICPLEFFFCRRHSHNNKGRERLRKPYFPLCAMWNQRMYLRFTFQPCVWWSNAATGFDLTSPKLITEEIILENAEKLYYQNTPLKYIVNRVKKESTLAFSSGNPQLQLTASFPVQSLFWFFRNKNYELTTDATGAPSGLYYKSRYNYGYTTAYIQTGVSLAFQSSNNVATPYVDVINTAKITLNNVDILSTFQGSLYYTFKQPIEHDLSIPSRNIYTYSFGITPAEYNQGGFLNFSKLNSQTTTLTLTFAPAYATEVAQGYNLYLFYYGYTILEFQNGFARLPFA